MQAYGLTAASPAGRRRGFPWSISPQPSLCSVRFRSRLGSLVLIGVIGSAFWHPFFWLSAFVGAGLVFAGISGFCGLGVLLSHMPWNRR
ncbi:MAG: DUF2892 domain-containing protein [Bilophila wadsworthia]